jgi:hypothetical protein
MQGATTFGCAKRRGGNLAASSSALRFGVLFEEDREALSIAQVQTKK